MAMFLAPVMESGRQRVEVFSARMIRHGLLGAVTHEMGGPGRQWFAHRMFSDNDA